MKAFKQLMTRDPRALTHVQKLAQIGKGKEYQRLYPGFSEFWSTRANRELRVIMTPTHRGWHIIALARKGGGLYKRER